MTLLLTAILLRDVNAHGAGGALDVPDGSFGGLLG
jgi:hypothetical protein